MVGWQGAAPGGPFGVQAGGAACPASDYAAGRIPGAISLPADEIDRRWNTLPKDRMIVLYESGRSSGDIRAASRAAGRTLLEHAFPFSQVKVYQDGLAGWQGGGYSAGG
jgi:rhodanese-related sulfurtransferase